MSKFDFKNALKGVKLCIFDLDGTLYIGDNLIDGAKDTLNLLRQNKKKILFLTNNSSASTSEYETKLKKKDIFEEGDEVFSSLKATCSFLKTKRRDKSVFALATPSAREELESYGVKLSQKAEIALLAFDKTISYDKMVNFNCLLNDGAEYIATHLDLVCPSPCGPIPDAGSFAEAFYLSSKRKPDIVIGKPSIFMGEAIMREFNLSRQEILMVGDRLYTDIRFGNNCGFLSALVLSGETNFEMAKNSSDKANVILDSVKDINQFL